jgi:hypothetical protein
MWWAKGILGMALLVLCFLLIQPAIVQRLMVAFGL